MSKRATVLTLLGICIAFGLLLGIRLLTLPSGSGVTVRVEREATHEELMTPGDGGGSAPVKTAKEHSVNLNTADADALQTVPGIGPVTAEVILAYREEHGPFSSVEELSEVPGIGESTLQQIQPYFTVEEDRP